MGVSASYLIRIWYMIPQKQDKQSLRSELKVYVVVAQVKGGELKTVADEYSLRVRWFHPYALEFLNVQWSDVQELIEMHRQGAPLLLIDAYIRHRLKVCVR